MCANWNIETKAGLHELETCILEAAELINRLATPQLRNWHKGNKEDKELNNATFKAWSEAISGIARLVFGYMNWKPKQSFNCASKLGHEFLRKPEMILEVESSNDETLESLFIKFFSPQRGQMWELWSWLNTLKEQQGNRALDMDKLRSQDKFGDSDSEDSDTGSSSSSSTSDEDN